jgi:peptide deformylase
MSILKIITIPNKKLRRKSQPIEKVTPEIKKLARDMIETLHSKPGLGLAAPQISKNLRLIIIESRGLPRANGEIADVIPLTILINPEIIKCSQKKVETDEGCFSVPNVFGPVTRPEKIKVKALNLRGKKIYINASSLLARVIQHEIDHLDGIVFIDLVKDKSRLKELKPDQEILG